MEKIEPGKARRGLGKLEPKNAHQEHESSHHRRRSTGSSAFSDSETVPNNLRATRNSCHDRCKSGFVSEDEQVTKSSRAAMGRHFQKKKKSAVNLEAALDSISRTSKVTKKETNISRVKPVISSSTAQQPRRSFGDFINSRRQRFNEPNQFIGSDGRKENVKVLPERSRSRIPKKQDNTSTEKNRKAKADNQVNDVTLGFTNSLDPICGSSSDERTFQKEATTSERVESEETSRCMGLTGKSEKQETESSSDEKTCTKETATSEIVQSEETSRCLGLTGNSEKQEIDSSSDERTCTKETATSELVQSEETSRCMGITGNSEKQETDLTAKIKSKAIRNELEDSDSSARKLKFRGGKVIAEQEDESSAKKLNFRQGSPTENQDSNINVPGVSLRKTEIENPESPIKHTPNVQLQGQVVEENNGSQGSYNSLIEETANKLSQTKSKVKALVGAFESVISLADTNSQPSRRLSVSIL